MNCQQCGREAALDAKFCVDCGSPLVLRCPACQTPYDLGSRFCSLCGRSLPGTDSKQPDESLPEDTVSEHSLESQQTEFPAQALQPSLSAPQSLSCPRCHQNNGPDADYCFACGLPLIDSEVSGRPFNVAETEDSSSPAGFWIRVGAFLVDLIVTLSTWFAAVVGYGIYMIGTTGDESFSFMDDPFWILLPALIMLFYHTLFVGLWATTVGKRLFGLYVTQSDGSRVGFARAFARHVASNLSGLILYIGYLQVAFREDKLSLHDLICGTKVVRRA